MKGKTTRNPHAVSLSPRERRVVRLKVSGTGMSDRAIAKALGVKMVTVETLRNRAMHKIGLRGHHALVGLTKWAIRRKLTKL